MHSPFISLYPLCLCFSFGLFKKLCFPHSSCGLWKILKQSKCKEYRLLSIEFTSEGVYSAEHAECADAIRSGHEKTADSFRETWAAFPAKA